MNNVNNGKVRNQGLNIKGRQVNIQGEGENKFKEVNNPIILETKV